MDEKKHDNLETTAELLSGIDDGVAEYSFSIDDILAEFGVERTESESPVDPEPESVPDTADEHTEALRETLEEMRTDLEREQLRAIGDDASAGKAGNVLDESGQLHVFEHVTTGAEKVKKRSRKNQQSGEEAGEKKRIVSRETSDMSKVFGNDFEKYFNKNDGAAESKKIRRKKAKSEKELERELFGGDAAVIPGSPDRTPVSELSEENIPVADKADELVQHLGRSHVRLGASALLCAFLALITFAPHLGVALPSVLVYSKTPYIYLFITAVLQVIVMLLCIETTVKGFRDALTFNFNMESVVMFAGLASLAHIVTVIIFPTWGGYLPFSVVTATTHLFASYFARRETLAKLRSCKAASGMSRPYIVCREPALYGNGDGIIKYRADEPRYFVNQLEKPDVVRRVWRIAAPIVIMGSIVFAAVASFANGTGERFPWALAAISAAASPFSLLLPYCATFAKAARRLGTIGSALAGWSAAEAFGEVDEIVLTDSDIFPPGSVSLGGLKVYGGYPKEKVIAYAASLVSMTGAGTARPFLDLLNEQSGKVSKVSAFKFYENSGIGGEIEGHTVLAGTAAFMMRTGIKIPQDVGGRPMVFVAINLELAGIFAVNYSASPAVENGLKMLARHQITPVFAVRDFNITPAMIEAKFKLSTDTVDFPKIDERLALSDADRLYFAKPSAVVSREGLGHYAEAAITARNLLRSTKVCLVMSLIGSIVGMLVMFYLAFIASPQTATPANLMLTMMIWLIPSWFAARWVNA